MATNIQPTIVDLWPNGAPHSNRIVQEESVIDGKINNITHAQLWIYTPSAEKRRNFAVVVFPGGGFKALNFESMGIAIAKWFNEEGITAIVVKYRMPNGDPIIISEDALEAMRIAYLEMEKRTITQLGVCGYSIGGNTASWLCRNAPKPYRPDFQILFYPVESVKDCFTHGNTRDFFMGKHPTAELIDRYSNENHVDGTVPPTFITLSYDDPTVPPIATLNYFTALKKENIPTALYIFTIGGHGWTFDSDFEYLTLCQQLLRKWLNNLYS